MRIAAALVFIICFVALCAPPVCCEESSTPAQPAASAKPSEPGHPYSSVIIDATGLGLDRCMSPKIRRTNGDEVWGTVKVDIGFVEDHGIVGYAKTLDEAKKSDRCGDNPMIIKATGRAGGAFRSDPIISDADADLLLAENKLGKFLDKFNVIFIKGDGGL